MNTPHDSLAKLTFSRPELAAEELLHALGPELAARIDPTSFKRLPGSYVSEEMRSKESDMLHSARLDGEEILIYALLEHQSNPQRRMALRVMGYKVAIWEDYARQNPDAPYLPIILTVVLHHGKTPWKWSVEFEALFHLPPGSCDELTFHIPRCGFVLDDLATQSEEMIRSRPASTHLRLVLLALQYARSAPSLEELLFRLLDLMRELQTTPAGQAALREVLCYIAQVRGRSERREFVEVAAALRASNQEDLMETIADVFINQGREQGRREGQTTVLLRQMRVRFGALPSAVSARVSAGSLEMLEVWAERLLFAATLDEVFATP